MVVASSVMWILLARGIEADSGFIVRGGKGIICKVKWGLCVPTLFAEKREKDGAPGTRHPAKNWKSASCLLSVVCILQLLQSSKGFAGHSFDGGRAFFSPSVNCGSSGLLRNKG